MNDFVFDSAHVAVHNDAEHPPLMKAGTSLRKRINLMCRTCIYDELAPGNWRQQVTACQIDYCPLWAIRPVSKPKQRIDSKADCDPQKAVLSGTSG